MTAVLDLWRKTSALPLGNRVFSIAFSQKAPYFASIRPRFTVIEPDRAELVIRKRRRVHNHLGTVHAIALCNGLEAAMGALDNDRGGYASLLEANRPTLLAELLRQEVAAGIDSGAEFARDRLKLQVEALQSTLKAGTKPGGRGAAQHALHALCALPALVDERTAHRIEQLIMRTAREGK